MYCPSCGSEENHTNQFCRSCGIELRSVRSILSKPNRVSSSAISAHDEIGQAIADKIRETRSVDELKKVVEDILPKLEQSLESPAEKRLRRMRNGTVTSSIGLGVFLMFLLMMSNGADTIIMVGLGMITFLIGLGIIINGLLFTVSKKELSDISKDSERQQEFKELKKTTNELLLPPTVQQEFSSVTEHTTKHLKNKKPV